MRKLHIEHWKVVALYLVIYDIIAVNLAYFLGLWLRFDLHFSDIPEIYLSTFFRFAPCYTAACLVVFFGLRLYNSLWRFASFGELNRVMAATVITLVIQVVGTAVFIRRMPISYYMFGCLAQLFLVLAVRFAYRYILLERARRKKNRQPVRNAMLIGAGVAGQTLLRELNNSPEATAKVRCIIDDNPNKWGRIMEGVLIVGGREDILSAVEKYHIEQILVAIPSASAKVRRDLLNICKETDCELKSLPGLYQLANGEVLLHKMKPVAVEDLLGREPIQVESEEVFRQLKGKTILVTGGGGSIGSELCRQIAGHEPGCLILLDVYENNAYEMEQELRRKYPQLNLAVLIGSVRDSRRMAQIFEQYRPEIVYHAAAHKHVPLMELSPNEAIKNNVIGTYKTAYAALKYGTKRFVLISTDKAVNPTNIMGASKRLCEMVIQSLDDLRREGRWDLLPDLGCHRGSSALAGIPFGQTEFVAVRFGNVLDSNGSVVPLFRRQIAEGGPVTVTHPDIIRYFMTIPEAVSLVLQAGTYAQGGEIFVLDMGDPVRIDDLARSMIRLSGFKPEEDISIVYTGLRPGEKLYEEKLMAEEGLEKTDNALIHIGRPVAFDRLGFLVQLEELCRAAYANDPRIVERIAALVTTYRPEPEQSAP